MKKIDENDDKLKGRYCIRQSTYVDMCGPEKNSGERITEQNGYIPLKKQVENMIIAGRRLNQSRNQDFDIPPETGITEAEEDQITVVTRDPNFDMADASQIKLDLQRKVKNGQRNRENSPDLGGSDRDAAIEGMGSKTQGESKADKKAQEKNSTTDVVEIKKLSD